MVNKSIRAVSTLYASIGIIVLLIIGFTSGYYMHTCPEQETSDKFPEDSAWRTDTLNLAGSTTVLPIAGSTAIAFMQKYTDNTITVQGGGSGQGYSQIISGVIDIGDASRPPKDAEIDNAKQQGVGLWLHPIALDAVCVVVNPSVADSLNLTLKEVALIYAGNYTHWDQLNPSLPHEEIYVVARESGSGTRGTFEEYTIDEFELTVDTSIVHEQPSNPAVRRTIETTDYSIGYVGFGFLTDEMVAVALAEKEGEGYIHPTLESIGSAEYPISKFLYFVTRTLKPESGSLTDRFIDFVLSPEGQSIVESEGFLRLPVDYNYP